jgi:hypothetical protein
MGMWKRREDVEFFLHQGMKPCSDPALHKSVSAACKKKERKYKHQTKSPSKYSFLTMPLYIIQRKTHKTNYYFYIAHIYPKNALGARGIHRNV